MEIFRPVAEFDHLYGVLFTERPYKKILEFLDVNIWIIFWLEEVDVFKHILIGANSEIFQIWNLFIVEIELLDIDFEGSFFAVLWSNDRENEAFFWLKHLVLDSK